MHFILSLAILYNKVIPGKFSVAAYLERDFLGDL